VALAWPAWSSENVSDNETKFCTTLELARFKHKSHLNTSCGGPDSSSFLHLSSDKTYLDKNNYKRKENLLKWLSFRTVCLTKKRRVKRFQRNTPHQSDHQFWNWKPTWNKLTDEEYSPSTGFCLKITKFWCLKVHSTSAWEKRSRRQSTYFDEAVLTKQFWWRSAMWRATGNVGGHWQCGGPPAIRMKVHSMSQSTLNVETIMTRKLEYSYSFWRRIFTRWFPFDVKMIDGR